MINDDQELWLEAENVDLRRLLAQAGIDAAEQKIAQKLQQLMVEELHHRVKNILATVQAITSQSLRGAQNLDDARKAIESRLQSLGRVHDLLLQTAWSSTKLETILRSSIQPFVTAVSPQFDLQSADIDVAPAAALPFAMIVNELCTNAVKYGALSTPAGRVRINASLQTGAESFLLVWREMNGPIVQEPVRRSFGSKLIEHAFASQLQAKANFRFDPAGVNYELEVPMAALKVAKPS